MSVVTGKREEKYRKLDKAEQADLRRAEEESQRLNRGRQHLQNCYNEITEMLDALRTQTNNPHFDEREALARMSKEVGLVPEKDIREILEGVVWVMANRNHFETRNPRYGRFEDRKVLAAARNIAAAKLRGDKIDADDFAAISVHVEYLEYLDRSHQP